MGIAVNSNFLQLAVNHYGDVYEISTNTSNNTATAALRYYATDPMTDIGANTGDFWTIHGGAGGNTIQRYNGGSWVTMPGGGTRVAASECGNPWVVGGPDGLLPAPATSASTALR